MALFKEYKNINFVIKRNMVESNKVTWMEPELCRDKLFCKLAGECLCFQFVFNFNCLHFFSQFLPPLSPAPFRSLRRPQSLHPPGWNECSCVAPHPLQSVSREGNPLGREQSQKRQHPLYGCPHFAHQPALLLLRRTSQAPNVLVPLAGGSSRGG